MRLEPPRIAVVSTHHYVNHGGSEMVVYRATPADVVSGVRVGDVEYPGFPAPAPASTARTRLKVAFFALLHDQDAQRRRSPRSHGTKPATRRRRRSSTTCSRSRMKKSRIEIDDKFMNRVVPEIIEHSPELKMARRPSSATCSPASCKINGELRASTPTRLRRLRSRRRRRGCGAGRSCSSATRRSRPASPTTAPTSTRARKSISRSTSASTSRSPNTSRCSPPTAASSSTRAGSASTATASSSTTALGVQSLYGHLMSFDVKVGDKVTRGQRRPRATRPDSPAAIICTSRCWSAAGWSTRSNGGTRTGSRTGSRIARLGDGPRKFKVEYMQVVGFQSFFVSGEFNAFTKARVGTRLGFGARGHPRRVRRQQARRRAPRTLPAAAPGAGGRRSTRPRPANVKGPSTLDGTAPKNEPIKMNADPVCVKKTTTPQFQETYAVGTDGKSLANVFVYVKDGLGNYVVRPADGHGQDRSEGMPLSSACVRHARRLSRSKSSTAIRRCTTSTRCRRSTASSTTASRFRA